MSEVTSIEPREKRYPTLYAIIGFKLLKGSLFLTLAIVAYCLSDNDLPYEFGRLLHVLRVHPGNRFFTQLAVKVGQITEVKMLWAAAGTLVYSLFSLVEGVGLIFRVSWAGWLAIGESAFFVPLEVHKLLDDFSWFMVAVTVINIFIVWYLYANRERLFHEPHHRHHPA